VGGSVAGKVWVDIIAVSIYRAAQLSLSQSGYVSGGVSMAAKKKAAGHRAGRKEVELERLLRRAAVLSKSSGKASHTGLAAKSHAHR
jgi:hypothetical protein